jgi:hypothetical protein
MEIKSGWYLIEQDQLHRVLAHADFAKLEPDSYVLHQVFETQREALNEMSRLIKVAINDLKDEVNKMAPLSVPSNRR